MRRTVWLLVLSVGCSSGLPAGTVADLAGADLTGAPHPDLAGADLTVAPGGFCAGTLVAGTCVQSFFAPLALCFAPSGGCITQSPMLALSPTWCWPNGDELKQMSGVDTSHRSYQSGNTLCFSEQNGFIATGPAFSAGTQTLYFDSSTGAYTCPDGSKGTIGVDFGGCSALGALIEPDTSNCTTGACP
jgi:hypothetical protein